MPRKSVKQKILENLVDVATQEIIDNESDDEAISEILDDLSDDIDIVLSCHRGIDLNLPKSTVWRNDILASLDEDRFKHMLRVTRSDFSILQNILEKDSNFNCAHSCKQLPIELQLAIVLYRLGENVSIKKIATNFGVGDGGTITNVTLRVFNAFLKLTPRIICWPSEEERKTIVAESYDELPYCIGYIDGTEIKLAEAPIQNHTSYFSRNRIYSIKAQVVCDWKYRIRNVVVGNYGSVHDAKIYRNSSIFKTKDDLFSSHQWIAGDSAYPLSEVLITPYRTSSTQMDKNARITFNKRLSKYRVRIEHVFGHLKERFGSLKELKIRVSDNKSHQLCSDWFLVCCIIHNILLKEEDINDVDLDDKNTTNENDENLSIREDKRGEAKRQAIFSLMR